jgi:hypothetical protein
MPPTIGPNINPNEKAIPTRAFEKKKILKKPLVL